MKLVRNLLIGALCAVMIVPSTGCSALQNMSSTGRSAIVGGAAGAGVGAGVGAIIGGGQGVWIGALIGSAIGAGAGALVGSEIDRQKKELEKELDQVKQQLNMTEAKADSAISIKTVKDSNNLKAIKIVLNDGILFNTGSASLSPSASATLSRIAYNLNQNPNTLVTVVGYTDNTGTYEQNMTLSQQRAQAVSNYLISQGVKASRVTSQGEGWNNPIVSNSTAAGRAQNRRVEIYITADENMINSAK